MENSGIEETKIRIGNPDLQKVLYEISKYYDSDSYIKSVEKNLRRIEEEARYIKKNSKIDEEILSARYTF